MRAAFVFLILLCGCLSQQQPQGETAPVLGNCTSPKCVWLKSFSENDSRYCESLSNDGRVVCFALSLGNSSLCEAIDSENLSERCVRLVQKASPKRSVVSCVNMSGDNLRWCKLYSGDCSFFDVRLYPDMASFCKARLLHNVSACTPISDNVMRNLCIRDVSGTSAKQLILSF